MSFWSRNALKFRRGETLVLHCAVLADKGGRDKLECIPVSSEGRKGRWGTPTIALHIRMQHLMETQNVCLGAGVGAFIVKPKSLIGLHSKTDRKS